MLAFAIGISVTDLQFVTGLYGNIPQFRASILCSFMLERSTPKKIICGRQVNLKVISNSWNDLE